MKHDLNLFVLTSGSATCYINNQACMFTYLCDSKRCLRSVMIALIKVGITSSIFEQLHDLHPVVAWGMTA